MRETWQTDGVYTDDIIIGAIREVLGGSKFLIVSANYVYECRGGESHFGRHKTNTPINLT